MKKGILTLIVVVLLMVTGSITYANEATMDNKGNVYVYYEDSDMHCVFIPISQIGDDIVICDVFVVEESFLIRRFSYILGKEPVNELNIIKDVELLKK